MRIPFSVYDFFGYLATGFVVLVSIDLSCGGAWLAKDSISPLSALFLILLAFVVGHLVAHIAGVLLENLFVRRLLRSPEEHVFGVAETSWRSRLFPGNFKPLPEAIQVRIRARAEEYGAPISERALFLHCHAVVKNQPTTLDRLNTFLVQYGFCRNISMAFAWAALVLVLGRLWCPSTPVPLFPWLPLALVLSVGMFYRYLKFFRHYTIEVFTSYAEAPPPPGKASKE
jgi:hypothetical protein